jgi:purine-nucleoside phosphorylase
MTPVSIHIAAQPGDIADTVLMPGDPLRAQWIAETFFENPVCYSRTRNMLGFTGTYNGTRLSVQGSGMGLPSISIYAHELFSEYDVQTIVRVGTCGALSLDLKLRDIVLAQTACTDSGMNRNRFHGWDFAPCADFGLLLKAYQAAEKAGQSVVVGPVLSSDAFYQPRPEVTQLMVDHGVLAVEMEASALYTLAGQLGRKALAVLTVSDHVTTGESTSADDRERTFGEMIGVALATVTA